jgi:hypothetical protein
MRDRGPQAFSAVAPLFVLPGISGEKYLGVALEYPAQVLLIYQQFGLLIDEQESVNFVVHR